MGCAQGLLLLAPRTVVLGRYLVETDEGGLLGEGRCSKVRRGTCLKTGKQVAVKEYSGFNVFLDGATPQAMTIFTQFRQQVRVLQHLREPFSSGEFEGVDPSSFFVELVDYSRDACGQPGPDGETGNLYIVTTLAEYSLQDYVRWNRSEGRAPGQKEIQQIAKSLVRIVAALHAKGFVHMDLKPQNLLVFDGTVKLIDLDGCVEAGTTICANDTWFMFSKLYCAPEVARFVGSKERASLVVSPLLDAWSIGMTIAEVACLTPVLYSKYKHHRETAGTPQAAERGFMDWLGHSKSSPLPHAINAFDPELHTFLSECLCVYDPEQRMDLGRCSGHPYIAACEVEAPQAMLPRTAGFTCCAVSSDREAKV